MFLRRRGRPPPPPPPTAEEEAEKEALHVFTAGDDAPPPFPIRPLPGCLVLCFSLLCSCSRHAMLLGVLDGQNNNNSSKAGRRRRERHPFSSLCSALSPALLFPQMTSTVTGNGCRRLVDNKASQFWLLSSEAAPAGGAIGNKGVLGDGTRVRYRDSDTLLCSVQVVSDRVCCYCVCTCTIHFPTDRSIKPRAS
ncbi:hypothetical protein N658DRAFT_236362 [Parathielavia hyrcaniae]|uniref:Uncharacterized protein n=1 Tax=Parathielavia hyrcaniae TaxID=113614 RepID=A0AAN6Q5J8_9PEZI|nr:hypothetical protein N658DRAFT_236362 [Parathielavia hyrcaniae]